MGNGAVRPQLPEMLPQRTPNAPGLLARYAQEPNSPKPRPTALTHCVTSRVPQRSVGYHQLSRGSSTYKCCTYPSLCLSLPSLTVSLSLFPLTVSLTVPPHCVSHCSPSLCLSLPSLTVSLSLFPLTVSLTAAPPTHRWTHATCTRCCRPRPPRTATRCSAPPRPPPPAPPPLVSRQPRLRPRRRRPTSPTSPSRPLSRLPRHETRYSDEKVANRDTKVWHGATEIGP